MEEFIRLSRSSTCPNEGRRSGSACQVCRIISPTSGGQPSGGSIR